jgi:hypothetical protein
MHHCAKRLYVGRLDFLARKKCRAPRAHSKPTHNNNTTSNKLAAFAVTMGLVSAAASVIKRCSFSQNISVPSRVERNVISLAADTSLATSLVSHGMQIRSKRTL